MTTDLPFVPPQPAGEPPASVVVRYGYMRMIGEFPYDGRERPRCGQKVILRGRRGTEVAEVLTTTCAEGACSVSVTREQLLKYVESSGGGDYPFTNEGRVVRVATAEDLEQQRRIEAEKPSYIAVCRKLIQDADLPMKLVDVEPLLGGEMLTFFFLSEHRVDFRALVKQLAARFHTRIQMHQVGARDEARLVADYETCGEHCCCKQFLKVLKPVNMGSAKMQKATLDPNKISGRCGRLKCCLRYEEATYEDLRKRLPRNGTRVRTRDGIGVVEETMILTQLVKVRLDGGDRVIAVANEELLDRGLPDSAVPRQRAPESLADESDERPWPRADRPPGGNGAQRSRPPRSAPSAGVGSNQPPASSDREHGPRPAPQPRPQQPSAPPAAPAENRQSPPPQQPPAPPPSAPQPPGIGAIGRRRRRRRGREGR